MKKKSEKAEGVFLKGALNFVSKVSYATPLPGITSSLNIIYQHK